MTFDTLCGVLWLYNLCPFGWTSLLGGCPSFDTQKTIIVFLTTFWLLFASQEIIFFCERPLPQTCVSFVFVLLLAPLLDADDFRRTFSVSDRPEHAGIYAVCPEDITLTHSTDCRLQELYIQLSIWNYSRREMSRRTNHQEWMMILWKICDVKQNAFGTSRIYV